MALGGKLVFVVVSLLFVVALVESHHRHKNKFRGRGRPIEGGYSWTRDLGRGRRAQEYAFVSPGGQVVYVQSTDDVLKPLNIQPANSVYDFSQAVPVGVLVPVTGPCYYTNTTLNLGQTISNLKTINNTVVSTANDVPFDGTAVPLSPAQTQNFFNAYPTIRPECDGRDIIPAYPPGAVPVAYPGPTTILQIFSIDSAVRVTIRQPQRQGNGGHSSSCESGSRKRHRGHRRHRHRG